MTNAFNDWTLPLVLQDPTLLRATMCMASAEMEIRRRIMPDGIRPSHAADDPLDGTMAISDYAYFKLQAIKHLNRALCSPNTGQLSAANICAIMFLLWAEVSLPHSTSPILSVRWILIPNTYKVALRQLPRY